MFLGFDMRSILDTGNSWFLERLLYGDSLIIFIVEGIRSPVASPIIIGEVNLGEGYSVDITDESRHLVVKFEDVIAYQIQNESFTYGDEYEKRTGGALCKYERSRYLDYGDSSLKCNKWTFEEYLIRRFVAERFAWAIVEPLHYFLDLPVSDL